jgi:hypothetical protein
MPQAPEPLWKRAIPYVVLGAIIVGWIVTTFPLLGNGGLQAALDTTGDVPRSGDYPHYYLAAKAAAEGANIFTSWRGGYVYPPLLAAALTPLVPLGLNLSAILWWLFIAGLFAWLWIVGLRELARRWSIPLDPGILTAASAITALVFLDPIRAFLALAQTDSLVMLGFAVPLAWLGMARGRDRPILAAFALAVSFHVKFLAIGLLPYLIVARKWAMLAWSALALVVVGLVPALVFGWQKNLEYLHISLARLGHVFGLPAPSFQLFNPHPLAWDRSRSITSGLARVAEHASLTPVFAYAGTALIAAAWIALAAWIYRRHGLSLIARFLRPASLAPDLLSRVLALEICSVIAAIMALGPQTAKRHAIVLIPAMLLAGLIIIAGRVPAARLKCAAGLLAILITSYLPATSVLALSDPWRSLGTLGGLGWAFAAFALLLLDAGLAEARALRPASPRVPSADA